MLVWNLWQLRRHTLELARNAAVTSYEKDLLYRQWVSRQGGVYAPVSALLPPNPHLSNVSERDIQTPSGRALTLVNPAYMTRQVHALGLELYKHRGHITSLNPLRPENAPDDWERMALQSFERGVPDRSEIATIEGHRYLRYMRPMRTDVSCLKCHEAQGYKEGDIRGGISVSVPMKEFEVWAREHRRQDLWMQGGVWLCGMAAIGSVGALLKRQQVERDRARTAAEESALRYRTLLDERKCIEDTLRRERDRAQAYLDTVQVIIAALDRSGGITLVNRAGCRLLEREEHELLGGVWFDLCLPKSTDCDRAHTLFSQSIETGENLLKYIELPIVTKSGAVRQIAWHSNLLRDGDGAVSGILCAGEDITERRQLENRLREAQKMEAIGRLAGGVAHDFNNILSATMLNIDLLRQQPHLTEDMRDMLGDLQTETQRAAEIVRQLLMFSQRSVFEYRALDMNLLVGRLVSMLEKLLGERVRIEFKKRAVAAFVEADEGMIGQTLLDICLYARDAMPQGGAIALSTEVMCFEGIPTNAPANRRPGTFVSVTIADSGPGMDEITLNRIFEPFFTTRELGRGAGLGLAAAYGIVVQHGGWVEVESRPGNGTLFRVLLPILVPKTDSIKGGLTSET